MHTKNGVHPYLRGVHPYMDAHQSIIVRGHIFMVCIYIVPKTLWCASINLWCASINMDSCASIITTFSSSWTRVHPVWMHTEFELMDAHVSWMHTNRMTSRQSDVTRERALSNLRGRKTQHRQVKIVKIQHQLPRTLLQPTVMQRKSILLSALALHTHS